MTHDATVLERDLPGPSLDSPALDAVALDPAAVFDQHGNYVWNTLRRLGVAHTDLEDLTHDTFVAVFRSWHKCDRTRPLRPWLFVFALGVASDHRRRARHRFEVSSTEEPLDDAPGAVELLLLKERQALAHAALGAVTLDRRAVLILHELDGCSVPEIAAALEIPVATAYSRLRLGREDLAQAARRLVLRAR